MIKNKKNILAGLLAAVFTVTGIPSFNGNSDVYAGTYEITNDKIAFGDNVYLETTEGFKEISIGDGVEATVTAVDGSGNTLTSSDWTFIGDQALINSGLTPRFYSAYNNIDEAVTDPDSCAFDYYAPADSFGKYVYYAVGIQLANNPDAYAIKFIRSDYTVTSWGDTEYQTFSLNDDKKTVRVFSIFDTTRSYKCTFPKTITVNEKKYKVNEIGDFALEAKEKSGLKAVTIHSGITKIGKNAFENATNLKTITIEGKVKKIGKNAFKNVNKKVVFKIKASGKDYDKIVKMIKKAGAPKTATFKKA